LHDGKNPKRGGTDGVQFATRRHDFVEGRTHVQNECNGGHRHQKVKPVAIVAVGEGGKPAPHGIGVVNVHNCCVHYGMNENVYNMNTENK
jgi:hypothetical protein